MSLAARIKKPAKMVMSIVNGGALLDYRTKDGVTAMHRAVQANNFEAVKTLLGRSSGRVFWEGSKAACRVRYMKVMAWIGDEDV